MTTLIDQLPFHFIDKLNNNLKDETWKKIKNVSFKKGEIIIQKGQNIDGVYVVKHGALRIYTLDSNGNEKPIDNLNAGEICVFSISSIMNKIIFPAWVTIDSESADVFFIPAQTFKHLYENDPFVRKFVLEAMASRIYNMMGLVEESATYDIGTRINNFLLRSCSESQTINIGHQEIATRLGTAREVVSRHLKHLENTGFITLSRMKIYILSPQDLAKILPK
jgi:CRP/FNR family transcriptional regulator